MKQSNTSQPAQNQRVNPILFLDIDGVLNTPASCAKYRSNEVFLSSAVAALRQIHARSNCDVVISSSWRMDDQRRRIQPVFEKNGLAPVLARIIGATPVLPAHFGATREDEIAAWLDAFGRPAPFAILDDDSSQFAGPLRARLVLIDDQIGLRLVPYRLNPTQKAQDFRRLRAGDWGG